MPNELCPIEMKISSKLIDTSTFIFIFSLQQESLIQQKHKKHQKQQRYQQFQCEINKSKNMSKWEGGEYC